MLIRTLFTLLFCLFASHSVSAGSVEEYDIPVRPPYFLDFGAWAGGDQVAENPDGDDYRTGSGGMISIGKATLISYPTQFYNHTSIGYRYQGARGDSKGESSGVILESALIRRQGKFHYGIGLHADFNPVIKNQYGDKTNFEDAIGTQLIFGYDLFSIRYLIVDYETTEGETLSGDQFGLILNFPITGSFW